MIKTNNVLSDQNPVRLPKLELMEIPLTDENSEQTKQDQINIITNTTNLWTTFTSKTLNFAVGGGKGGCADFTAKLNITASTNVSD